MYLKTQYPTIIIHLPILSKTLIAPKWWFQPSRKISVKIPSKIEWDLTNGPLSKLLKLLDTQVEGSVQWILLEISWKNGNLPQIGFYI